MQNKTVSRITLTSSEIKGGFEGYFYWRKVKSFQKDGDTADVLVLMFWLCARQFKIPINFLFLSFPYKNVIDHWALTTGVRDLPLAKSVVVVTGFCFSNTVNILSS